MKKQFIVNLVLSAGFLFLLLITRACFVDHLSPHYYFGVIFLFFVYSGQIFLLSTTSSSPQKFILIYNLTTIVKMLMAAGFLIAYYVFFEQTLGAEKKMAFSIFFVSIYTIYLVINAKLFFGESKEKTN